MTSTDNRRRAGVLVRVLVVLLAWVVALVVLPASRASAHTELVASTPGDSAPVSLGVDAVVLTFTDDVIPGASAVVVTGPAGEEVTVTPSSVQGAVVTAGLALRDAGRHTVTYRVVGADGHVVTGSYWFTAIVGVPPIADSSAVPRVNAPDGSVTAGEPGAEPSSGVLGASATAGAPGTTPSGPPLVLVLLGLGLVLVFVAVLRSMTRQRLLARSDVGERWPQDLTR